MPHPALSSPAPDDLARTLRALGRRLQLMRIHQGRSQIDLADTLGLSPRTLRRLEAGRSWPRLDTLLTLCGVLGVTPTEVLGNSTPTNGPTLFTSSLRALCQAVPPPAARQLSQFFTLLAAHSADAPGPRPARRRP